MTRRPVSRGSTALPRIYRAGEARNVIAHAKASPGGGPYSSVAWETLPEACRGRSRCPDSEPSRALVGAAVPVLDSRLRVGVLAHDHVVRPLVDPVLDVGA